MTPYDFPLTCTFMNNPNRIPSFKKGDLIVLLEDDFDSEDPDDFLFKGDILKIEKCGLFRYVFSQVKISEKGELLEEGKFLHPLNNIKKCLVDFETEPFDGREVKAENCRLATMEEIENDDNY